MGKVIIYFPILSVSLANGKCSTELSFFIFSINCALNFISIVSGPVKTPSVDGYCWHLFNTNNIHLKWEGWPHK